MSTETSTETPGHSRHSRNTTRPNTMKRTRSSMPGTMVQRLSPLPSSCQLCRQKKLRCDRKHPCSNCDQRQVPCLYAGGPSNLQQRETNNSSLGSRTDARQPAQIPTSHAPKHLFHDRTVEDILERLHRLEAAVFEKNNQSTSSTEPQPSPCAHPVEVVSDTSPTLVPHGLQFPLTSSTASLRLEPRSSLACIGDHLPPREHAVILLDHYVETVDFFTRVVHVPSVRSLLENTYDVIREGREPATSNVLLLLSISASSEFFWTRCLIEKLALSPDEARRAWQAHSSLARRLLENADEESVLNTVTLQAVCILANLLTNSEGLTHAVHMLRMRGVLMAQSLQLHLMDSERARQERLSSRAETSPVDLEVKRRIWWHLVSTDWLLALSGGPQEGTYSIQPQHMRVNLPRNIDDEYITADSEYNLPLAMPTSMSSFLLRTQLAELCRASADALSTTMREATDPDYSLVLRLGAQFQDFIQSLPPFLQLPSSASSSIQPSLVWQRVMLHLSISIRIGRLHRPFLLASKTNARYASSRTTCIHAAQTVLQLRRLLDDPSANLGIAPARFTVLVRHVFLAALILATAVSIDPGAAGAEATKADALAACKLLETSPDESSAAAEGIQKGVQKLRDMLATYKPAPESQPQTQPHDSLLAHNLPAPSAAPVLDVSMGQPGTSGDDDLERLWSQFLDVAPELDSPQWSFLLDNMDVTLGPGYGDS